ncbi:unnamed protein product, partial [Rotaria sp. Silwood1]
MLSFALKGGIPSRTSCMPDLEILKL